MSDERQHRLDQATLIAEHYQHTFESTIDAWKQRNRLFIILVIVIGFSSFFALEGPDTQGTLIKLIAAIFGGNVDAYVSDLTNSYVMGFLQSILVTIVFFLMFNLYHRSIAVSRNYLYLGQLEDEIRVLLRASPDWVLFTREGDFYWRKRETAKDSLSQKAAIAGQKWAKWVYISVLSALLGAFIYVTLRADLNQIATKQGEIVPYIVMIVDSIIMLLTGFYFASYTFASSVLDKTDKVDYKELLAAEISKDTQQA